MMMVVVGCVWGWGGGGGVEVRIVRTEKHSNYLPVPFSLAGCAVLLQLEARQIDDGEGQCSR